MARATGPDSKATLAVSFSARLRRDQRYAAALARYDAAKADHLEDA